MLVRLQVNATNDIFQGLSILLLSEDDARAKALSKALRDQRARVAELGARTREGGRGVDLAIVDARSEAASASQLAALRADVRGRWASVVSVDYEQLVKGDGSVLLAGLAERAAPLIAADHALTERAREETTFKTTLSPLGPPRTLRALSLSGHTLFVELRTRTLEALVEVSNELLVSASATRGDKRWEAWSALVRILGLNECEITVSRRSFTSFMNIMEPVDQALEVAAQERQCSADQIAREEAEADAAARSASPKLPPARMPEAATMPPPTPAAARQPPPTPRAMGTLGHQRTLMGVIPGLPSPSIAANDVRAIASKPPPAEPPRYAHRHTDARGPGLPATGGARASMTLMGVAPAAIPGLAELRAQRAAQEKVAAPAADARDAQRAALKNALNEAPDFDPPTVRHNMASLQDLTNELPDLIEDFSMAAEPLSSPLPPPPSERNEEREPRPGMTFDDDDSQEQTIVASSQLTQELLAQALEGAATERPPPGPNHLSAESVPSTVQVKRELLAVDALAAEERAEETASTVEARGSARSQTNEQRRGDGEIEPGTSPRERQDKGDEPAAATDAASDFGPGEETLVVHRKAEKPKSRAGLAFALAVVTGLVALAFYGAMESQEAQPVTAASPAAKPVSSAPAVQPKPAPVAVVEAPGAVREQDVEAAKTEPATDIPPSEPVPAQPEPAAAAEPAPPSVERNVRKPAAVEAREPNAVQAPEPARQIAPAEPAPSAEPKAAADVADTKAAAELATDTQAPSAGVDALEPNATGQVNELLKKGQRLLAQRDAAGARVALEQALALQADNPHVRASLAESLLKLNELPLALVQAQTAVKLRPKRGRYLVILGDVLAAMGKPDEARASFQHAFELDPNDVEAKRKAGL
jgi:hypothetical protein